MPTAITAPCPECSAQVAVKQELNIWGEPREVLRCLKCRSLYTSQDGIHWMLIATGKKPKET